MTKIESYKREVINKIKKLGFELVGDYINTRTKTAIKCKCGSIFYTCPTNIISGRTRSCGCSRSQNHGSLIGNRYGKLKVIEYSRSDGKNRYWKCKCDCGNTHEVKTSHLTSSAVKSCGCLADMRNHKSSSFNGFGEIPSRRWKTIMISAKKRNITFNISIEEAWASLLCQERRCALTGESIGFVSTNNFTASLDRINSELGYLIDNIQWVHKHINLMKWDLSAEKFLNLCCLVIDPIKVVNPYPSVTVGEKHCHWRGCGNITGHLWSRYTYAAKKRKMTFDVTIKEAWDQFLAQNGACAITGLEITFPTRSHHVDEANSTASLDRIDSNIGYVRDNIQWVHKYINTKLKREIDEVTMREWCKKVVKYQDHRQV